MEVALKVMMNNKLQTLLIGGVLSASIVTSAQAGDFTSPLVSAPTASSAVAGSDGDTFSFGAGYHSTYVWRGLNFGREMADWSLEASKSVGDIDLTAGVWGANVFTVQGGSEVDFYVSASKDLGFATAELGYIFYYFDGATSTNTQEVYLSLSKDIAGTSFSATYYYDFDQVDDSYMEFGAERSLNLGGFDLDASVALGFLPEHGEFTHVQPTLSKTIKLNSAVELTPYVSYSFAIEDVDSLGNNRDDEFVAGASLGFSF